MDNMPEPFLKQFTLPDGKELTAVIIDHDEFLSFCDELAGVMNLADKQRVTTEQIAALKEAKHLPMMQKGTLTAKFFDKWGVTTDHLSVMVRGAGREMLQQILESN